MAASSIIDKFSEQVVVANFEECKMSTEDVAQLLCNARKQKKKIPSSDNDEEFPIVIDVRSPVEFLKGHVPGAINVPLFTDKEREIVGKTFKFSGREAALKVGIKYVRPKLETLLFLRVIVDGGWDGKKHDMSLMDNNDDGTGDDDSDVLKPFIDLNDPQVKELGPIHVYCARGGLRSKSMCWYLRKHLELSTTCVVEGGYKAFKHMIHNLWDDKNDSWPKVCVVAGRTGAGKTKVLLRLAEMGEQVIDLEGLAKHKGSAFGNLPFQLNNEKQPSNEQFLNELGIQWMTLDGDRWLYVEDEGCNCGDVRIHLPFYYKVLRECDLVVDLKVPEAVRRLVLVEDYANPQLTQDARWRDTFVHCLSKAKKRLGPDRLAQCMSYIDEAKYGDLAGVLLTYYDGLYDKHIKNQGGTGSGTGERKSVITAVSHESTEALQIDQLCTGVMKKAEEFKQQL